MISGFEGVRKRNPYKNVSDSHLQRAEFDQNQKWKKYNDLIIGEILFIQPEPIYSQTKVAVKLKKGGLLTSVAWPSGNVEGTLHGTFTAPTIGQQVLIGFVGGNASDPVIVQVYPYQISSNPLKKAFHIMPLAKNGFSALDNLYCHNSGSYLALRGMPVPGQVDLHASTYMKIDSIAGIDMSSMMDINISSKTNVNINVSGGKIAVSPLSVKIDYMGNSVELKNGNITINSTGTTTVQATAEVQVSAAKVTLNGGKILCNNLQNCIFSGALHSTANNVFV